MIPYLTRRAVHSAFALFGLFIAVFFLARLTGDPTDLFLPVDASLEDRVEFAHKHGYDRPAVDVVLEAYPATLKLAGVTLLFGISLAVAVGALAAYRPGGLVDRIGSTFALISASAPDFWVAITAILVFSVRLGWFPTSGTGGFPFWIMPVTVLA